MKRHLQWGEQQESQSNFTKYCTCHAKWISWLIRVLHETSFTMSGATGITIQLHQILHLPRKMNLMIDPRHLWNVIYNARSNKRHGTSSPNTAPATQNESHDWSASHMKRHLQCAEQAKSPSNLTKYCACHEILSSRFQRKIPELLPPIERRFDDHPTTIRRPSGDHPTTNRHLAPAASEPPWRRILYGKNNISRSGYLSKFHQVLRLPRKVTLQLHQILCLPRKMHPTLL